MIKYMGEKGKKLNKVKNKIMQETEILLQWNSGIIVPIYREIVIITEEFKNLNLTSIMEKRITKNNCIEDTKCWFR